MSRGGQPREGFASGMIDIVVTTALAEDNELLGSSLGMLLTSGPSWNLSGILLYSP